MQAQVALMTPGSHSGHSSLTIGNIHVFYGQNGECQISQIFFFFFTALDSYIATSLAATNSATLNILVYTFL